MFVLQMYSSHSKSQEIYDPIEHIQQKYIWKKMNWYDRKLWGNIIYRVIMFSKNKCRIKEWVVKNMKFLWDYKNYIFWYAVIVNNGIHQWHLLSEMI